MPGRSRASTRGQRGHGLPGERFRPEDRLRRRSEFLFTQKNGRKWATRDLLLFHVRTDAPVRFGITVSKRVGTAVVRNRVKRRLREMFRRNRSLFPRLGNLVVVAKPSAATAPLERLLEQIQKLQLATS